MLVLLSGEIDILTAPDISDRLDRITYTGDADLLIDLRAVEFMDGSGVRLLVRARSRTVRRGGRLRLICTGATLLRLLNHPQLNLKFDILGDLPVPVPPEAPA
ncbi:STAS domain-containing protein [Streptomyces sp. NPDC006552]|uniref:STAS domain-containing protein n=1 Tax=Streptomyces sp. NPDC006552 TaxID=3157179 RepID=UPI0033AB6970